MGSKATNMGLKASKEPCSLSKYACTHHVENCSSKNPLKPDKTGMPHLKELSGTLRSSVPATQHLDWTHEPDQMPRMDLGLMKCLLSSNLRSLSLGSSPYTLFLSCFLLFCVSTAFLPYSVTGSFTCTFSITLFNQYNYQQMDCDNLYGP